MQSLEQEANRGGARPIGNDQQDALVPVIRRGTGLRNQIIHLVVREECSRWGYGLEAVHLLFS
jgi:hypothetical protein